MERNLVSAAANIAVLSALCLSASAARTVPDPATALVPVYFAPRATAAPKLDGKLDDACWKRAPAITDFGLILRHQGPAQKQTHVQMVYDEEAVYVGFRCIEPQMALLRARTKDDYLWRCDSLEIYLRPDVTTRTRYHLVTNVAGARFDAWVAGKALREDEKADPFWGSDAKWRAAGRRGTGEWTVEVRLPYSDFGIRPGRTFTANLVRLTAAGGQEFSAWAHVGVDQKDFRFWGHFVFAGAGLDEVETAKGLVPNYAQRVVSWPTAHGVTALDHGKKKETTYGRADMSELKGLDDLIGPLRTALGKLPGKFPSRVLSKKFQATQRRRDALAARIQTERFSAVGLHQIRGRIEAAAQSVVALEWEVRCQQLAAAVAMQAD